MNAERKWMPGPWEIGDLDAAGQRMVRQEHLEICTCWHHGVGSIEKEMEANARLIAAAPDMYEALKAAGNSAGFQYMPAETREKIDVALSKAECR